MPMKPKMTEDFKKAAKGIIIYMVTAIFVFPVLHLIKGDFNWGDTFFNAGLMILIGIVLGLFFFFGMQKPQKKDQ